MPAYISISESEWAVMKIIWSEPPKTLQDILGSLKHTGWSTTTIQTYLAPCQKGRLGHRAPGKTIPVLSGRIGKGLPACGKPDFSEPYL